MTIAHGLETTVAEYEALPSHQQNMIKRKIHHTLRATLYIMYSMKKRLIVCHAGIRQDYIGRKDKKYKPLYYTAILQEKTC